MKLQDNEFKKVEILNFPVSGKIKKERVWECKRWT